MHVYNLKIAKHVSTVIMTLDRNRALVVLSLAKASLAPEYRWAWLLVESMHIILYVLLIAYVNIENCIYCHSNANNFHLYWRRISQ